MAAPTALPPIPDRLNWIWPERLLVMKVRLAAYPLLCQTLLSRRSKYRGSCLSNVGTIAVVRKLEILLSTSEVAYRTA
jgi:hypothetical protein